MSYANKRARPCTDLVVELGRYVTDAVIRGREWLIWSVTSLSEWVGTSRREKKYIHIPENNHLYVLRTSTSMCRCVETDTSLHSWISDWLLRGLVGSAVIHLAMHLPTVFVLILVNANAHRGAVPLGVALQLVCLASWLTDCGVVHMLLWMMRVASIEPGQ